VTFDARCSSLGSTLAYTTALLSHATSARKQHFDTLSDQAGGRRQKERKLVK
jgi:hypothetical protein